MFSSQMHTSIIFGKVELLETQDFINLSLFSESVILFNACLKVNSANKILNCTYSSTVNEEQIKK